MYHRPKYLHDEAREFWDRHAYALEQSGLLTDRDIESFALLCDVWRQLRNVDPDTGSREALRYNSLLKIYQNLAKQFGLLPRDRKRSGIEEEASIEDVIKLKLEKRSDAP